MTPEQARELFSEAFEEALEPLQAAAFRDALAADAQLAADYEAFCATMELTRGLAADTPPPRIDVLPAVQRTLRQRSHGRFYRDRYAGRAGAGVHPLLVAGCMLLVTGIVWLAFELYTRASLAPASEPRQAPVAGEHAEP